MQGENSSGAQQEWPDFTNTETRPQPWLLSDWTHVSQPSFCLPTNENGVIYSL